MSGPKTEDEYRTIYETHLEPFTRGGPEALARLLNGMREHLDRFCYVMTLVRKLAPQSVLDLACNIGVFGSMMRWSSPPAPQVIHGADISPSALAVAGTHMGYDKTFCCDITQSQDFGRQYDLVLCQEVLEHVHEAGISVVVKNVLRHAGKWALFSVPDERETPDGVHHVRVVGPDDLRRWLGPKAAITYLPLLFTEKPRWQGCHMALYIV